MLVTPQWKPRTNAEQATKGQSDIQQTGFQKMQQHVHLIMRYTSDITFHHNISKHHNILHSCKSTDLTMRMMEQPSSPEHIRIPSEPKVMHSDVILNQNGHLRLDPLPRD